MVATAPTGKRLGRYQVIRHLASGGMAEIYLAQGIGETVVVKVISADRAQDKKFVQMFLDEARVAATLHHPNIAQMLEVGRQDETYFFAMEYVDGETARALLERAVATGTKIPLAVSLKIVASVAAGLHHAHERKGGTGAALQIVHRDVTPSNIMIGRDGSVKLLDFGIAQAEGRAAETQSGTIKGKFAYMSPEQCRGKNVDRRTDVFALGIVLYELTTRRRAFRTDNDFDTMDRIVRGRWTRPTQIDPTYPRELEAILTRALAIELSNRYATAAELARALDDFATRHGALATGDDIAAYLRDVFGATDVELVTAPGENTASDVELQLSPGLEPPAAPGFEQVPSSRGLELPWSRGAGDSMATAATPVSRGPAAALADAAMQAASIHDTLHDDDDADNASTQRRLRAPIAAMVEAAALEALEPQSTGPMPVMSTARSTGPLAVQVSVAATTTGPTPQVALPPMTSTGENPKAGAHPKPEARSATAMAEATGANVGAVYDARPPAARAEGTGAGVGLEPRGGHGRTILGAAPASVNRRRPAHLTGPGVAPSVADSGRGPGVTPTVSDSGRGPVLPALATVAPPASESTHLVRRRHRRGLAVAIVLVLVVVGLAVGAVVLLGGGSKDPAAPSPSAAPTTP